LSSSEKEEKLCPTHGGREGEGGEFVENREEGIERGGPFFGGGNNVYVRKAAVPQGNRNHACPEENSLCPEKGLGMEKRGMLLNREKKNTLDYAGSLKEETNARRARTERQKCERKENDLSEGGGGKRNLWL